MHKNIKAGFAKESLSNRGQVAGTPIKAELLDANARMSVVKLCLSVAQTASC